MVETFSYGYGGGQYTVSKTICLSKKAESVSLKIEGWSNRRLLYIDKESGISYFQASAESTDCHRCGICQKRMQSVGWRTGSDFVRIQGHASLYLAFGGTPEDTKPETLSRFLGLSIDG